MREIKTEADSLRCLDKWIGTPICVAFSFFDYISKFFRKSNIDREKKNILVILLSEMGSCVLCHTALKRLQEDHPTADIYYLTLFKNKDVGFLLEMVSPGRLLTLDHSSPFSFAMDCIRFIFRSRKIKFDVAIDFELFTRVGSILSYLSGAPVKAGYYGYNQAGLYRGSFLTRKVAYNIYQHIGYNFLALVEALNWPDDKEPVPKNMVPDAPLESRTISVSGDEKKEFKDKLILAHPGLANQEKIILFNPSGGELPIRAWPIERYVLLGQHLLQNANYSILITGTRSDKQYNDKVATLIGSERSINIAGLTKSIPELLALFELSSVLIANDGGTANFASLTTIDVIVLFGPETPTLYAPIGERITTIYEPTHCSPCLTAYNHRNSACDGDNQCLSNISVEMVEAKARQILDDEKPRN